VSDAGETALFSPGTGQTMMLRIAAWLAALTMIPIALPPSAMGQGTGETPPFRHAVEMRVRVAHAPLHTRARQNAEVIRTLAWNERVLVLRQEGPFYHVVEPVEGLQGYVLSTQLRATTAPLGAADMPEDLRRRRNYVGTRFDVQAGVAVPYRMASFADGFNPGASIDVRLSHPLSGPLGLTARIAYRQFGRSDGGTVAPLPEQIDVRGRDLSLLAGAVGIDLTAFRGHWIAFVATVDGGPYHAVASTGELNEKPVLGEASSLAWGGSASARITARVGGPVRLFAEPGYEIVWADDSTLHLVPMRIGLSLER
jgi:hypothetical protein